MYVVYILRSCVNGRYYIGHSGNLVRRLKEHNRGVVRSTKAFRPWEIVHSEEKATKGEAVTRELQIKRYRHGEAFLRLLKSDQ